MTLRFPYVPEPMGRPLVPPKGRAERPRPLIGLSVVRPLKTVAQDALLDAGADDTVLPEWVAFRAGIDLSNAPIGTGAGVGRKGLQLRYAEVTLRIADNHEHREWKAWVGFTQVQFRYPMLGFAGFLEYFTARFHGDLEEVELTVNSRYAGT